MNDISINTRIREAREYLKLKQKTMAVSVGSSQGHWSDVEGGKGTPSETLLVAIAYRWQISLDWLKTGEGPMLQADRVSETPTNYEPNPEVQTLISRIKHIYQHGSENQKALLYGQIGRVYDGILSERGSQGDSGDTDRPGSKEEKKTSEGYKVRKPA